MKNKYIISYRNKGKTVFIANDESVENTDFEMNRGIYSTPLKSKAKQFNTAKNAEKFISDSGRKWTKKYKVIIYA